jgi:hypothetical protein
MTVPRHAGATHQEGLQCAGAAFCVLLKVESDGSILVKFFSGRYGPENFFARQRLVATTVTPGAVSKKARHLSLIGADMA